MKNELLKLFEQAKYLQNMTFDFIINELKSGKEINDIFTNPKLQNMQIDINAISRKIDNALERAKKEYTDKAVEEFIDLMFDRIINENNVESLKEMFGINDNKEEIS